ncbi:MULTISPECIES: bcscK [Ralstonia]|uniref:BcscK n=1 Tax=Ralstonia mojiangensis TaxID=2953895 RepID=A0AAE3LE62_9RALS|nr:bcscK [Ralstonia mojiangensis]MCO5414451.1 bcscK [Ralstonia mojiangensis]MCT7318107.1 bcscK [Ralstonia mojiangensis]MCT7327139.1 bcscK [Ralstonia mojiangensis]
MTASGMLTPDSARLARLLCAWNLRFDRVLHPSWLPAEWPARFRNWDRFGPQGRRVLMQELRRHEPALDGFIDCVDSREARLCLLPRQALAQLSTACGIVLHRAWIEDMAGKRLTRVLHLALGRPLMESALQHAAAFDAVAESLSAYASTPRQVIDVLQERGARLLIDLTMRAAPEHGQRLALTFARAAFERAPYTLNAQQWQQVADLVFLCFIPEQLPAWDWLF